MKRFLLLAITMLALLCVSAFLRAEGPDDEYVRIYNLIQQADALAEDGRGELARQKYAEAQTELDRVQKAYPGWNAQVVQVRDGKDGQARLPCRGIEDRLNIERVSFQPGLKPGRGKQIILTDERYPLRAPVDLSAGRTAAGSTQPCLS